MYIFCLCRSSDDSEEGVSGHSCHSPVFGGPDIMPLVMTY